MRGRRATSALCLLLALVLCPAAQAAYDPVGGGTAKLSLDPSFAAFLKKDGLKLTAKPGAKKKGGSYVLPIISGNLDPTIGKGQIATEGTLVFGGKRKSVLLRKIRIQTKRAPLIAKVGGNQLKAAQGAKLSFKRAGFDSTLKAAELKLTPKLITRLNKKLRPKIPFEAGQLLGTITSRAEPQLVTIEDRGKATLVFDSSFLAKLDQRFVSLNPVFPAEHVGATFSLPIGLGGLLGPDGAEGTLHTAGAIEMLQLGGGQIFWQEQWLDLAAHSDSAEADLEPTPSFPGKLGRVGVFDISGGAFASDPGSRMLSLGGAQLSLSAEGASELNEAFAQEGAQPFAQGEAAGTLAFTAQGQ
jgi:hypothetical protein